jgi:hypothetical protein
MIQIRKFLASYRLESFGSFDQNTLNIRLDEINTEFNIKKGKSETKKIRHTQISFCSRKIFIMLALFVIIS